MKELRLIPLLTTEQEKKLAIEIQGGSIEAYQKFLLSNQRLLVKIAKKYTGMGVPILDLISEGNMGMMRALEKFDPSKGAKFSSYSAWWIKQAMKVALSNQSRSVNIPIEAACRKSKTFKALKKLEGKLGRRPTLEEVSEHTGYTLQHVIDALRFGNFSISIDAKINPHDQDDKDFSNLFEDERSPEPYVDAVRQDNQDQITRFLKVLTEREKRVLTERYGLNGEKPKTLEQVSKDFGFTRERVRQIQNEALKKLKSWIEEENQVVVTT